MEAWLRELGLGELGAPLDDGKRLRKAIARPIGDTRSAEPAAVAGTASATAILPVSEAERRHVSAMLVGLAGSTALAERRDPEGMREVLQEFHRAAAGAIETQDGRLARYLGDGILVYSGYPCAHGPRAKHRPGADAGASGRRFGDG